MQQKAIVNMHSKNRPENSSQKDEISNKIAQKFSHLFLNFHSNLNYLQTITVASEDKMFF